MYTISINKEDFAYILAAIGQRAEILQGALMIQARDHEEKERRQAEEQRRAKLPDPFKDDMSIPQTKIELSPPIVVPKAKPEDKPVSRKQKRAVLMRVLKAKGSADLSTAEIARRAGVSYVTAHKARAAFATKKGRK